MDPLVPEMMTIASDKNTPKGWTVSPQSSVMVGFAMPFKALNWYEINLQISPRPKKNNIYMFRTDFLNLQLHHVENMEHIFVQMHAVWARLCTHIGGEPNAATPQHAIGSMKVRAKIDERKSF